MDHLQRARSVHSAYTALRTLRLLEKNSTLETAVPFTASHYTDTDVLSMPFAAANACRFKADELLRSVVTSDPSRDAHWRH